MDLAFALSAVWLAQMTEQKRPKSMNQEIAMPEVNNPDTELWILVGIIAFLILLGLLVGLCLFVKDFLQELEYINMEIQRTDGSERRYWIRKRRRLWLSLIPFVKY